MGDEDIIVDAWNGASWDTVFSDISPGWNNASITTWLTSSTFTIRFKDGSNLGDIIIDFDKRVCVLGLSVYFQKVTTVEDEIS